MQRLHTISTGPDTPLPDTTPFRFQHRRGNAAGVRTPIGIVAILRADRQPRRHPRRRLAQRERHAHRDIDSIVRSGLMALICAASAGPSSPSVRSEEPTSELQSLMRISYAVFCLKKKNNYV